MSKDFAKMQKLGKKSAESTLEIVRKLFGCLFTGPKAKIVCNPLANLPQSSYVSAESLHSLPKERMRRYLGELPMDIMEKINRAVIFALALTTE